MIFAAAIVSPGVATKRTKRCQVPFPLQSWKKRQGEKVPDTFLKNALRVLLPLGGYAKNR
jgi:hypothetical protein